MPEQQIVPFWNGSVAIVSRIRRCPVDHYAQRKSAFKSWSASSAFASKGAWYSKAKVWIASAQYFGVAKTHMQMVIAAISQTLLKVTNLITLNKPQQSHNANRRQLIRPSKSQRIEKRLCSNREAPDASTQTSWVKTIIPPSITVQ